MSSLSELIGNFRDLRTLVIGDAILDSYLAGSATRIAREAPVPIVDISARRDVPGGAANTAANLSALGASVSFLSVTGHDADGERLRAALQQAGVPVEHIAVEEPRQTSTKHRVTVDRQLLVRFDQGGSQPITPATEAFIIDALRSRYASCDAVVVSDYGYGALTPAVINALASLQSQTPRVLVVDARDLSTYAGAGITAAKPNYEEAISLLGLRPAATGRERLLQIGSEGGRLLDLTGAQLVTVTLEAEGSLLFQRDAEPYRTYARRVANTSAAGAGDTFTAALTLALAAGADSASAAEVAAAAAAVVVEKEGTACCSVQELRAALSIDEKYVSDLSDLMRRVSLLRSSGQRIVFTNGCFDILHRGHIGYLNRAKALADQLIIALNDDAGVRRLKGPDRPINTLEDRAQVLGALSCVDHIVPFSEDTAARIIEAVRPDLFVKGGDYTRETLPEAALVEELGGVVQILPYLEERSTSSIIERIRQVPAAASSED